MKKFLNLTILAAIVLLSMAAMPADKHSTKSIVTIYIHNGTNWYGTLQMSGAGSLYSTFNPTSSSTAGTVSTGTYSVTITCGTPGNHLYMFTGGYSMYSSTGTVTFPSVSVTSDAIASIY